MSLPVADVHIDDFNRDAALILMRLYGCFPRRKTLYVEDICGTWETDDCGLPTTRQQACLAAHIWLAEEGLIRYDSLIRQEAVDQAVLSNTAFVLLNLHYKTGPDSTTVTLIQAIANALHEGSSTQLAQVMTQILQRLHQGGPLLMAEE